MYRLSNSYSALLMRRLFSHMCIASSLNTLRQGCKCKVGVVQSLYSTHVRVSFFFAGAPQVLRQSGGREVVVARGQDALLRLVVCADPRPRRAAWEWGSQQLEAGADLGRYKAEELAQASEIT
jgi:hypothetical protein